MSPVLSSALPVQMAVPNPLREDGLYPVLVSPGLLETLADRVEWGEPDADGFYTPTLYRDSYAAVAEPAEDRIAL